MPQLEHAVVDLDHLAQYTGGDRNLEDQLFSLFLLNAVRYIDDMAQSGGGQTWKMAAHTLKGGARGIGAWDVADQSEQAEAALHAPDDARDRLIRELRDAVERVRAFVEARPST